MNLSYEHPEELLAFYVNGTLEGEEQRRVSEHLRLCITCRREVAVLEDLRRDVKDATGSDPLGDEPAGELLASDQGLKRLLDAIDSDLPPTSLTNSTQDSNQHGGRPTLRYWLPLAVAALMVAALGLKLFPKVGTSTPDTADGQIASVRDAGSELEINSALPLGATLPAPAFVLRWHVSEEWRDARFSLRLTTADLAPIYAADDLQDPQLVVPAETFAGLAPGTRLLWQVDARLADGRRSRSPSFFVQLGRADSSE